MNIKHVAKYSELEHGDHLAFTTVDKQEPEYLELL